MDRINLSDRLQLIRRQKGDAMMNKKDERHRDYLGLNKGEGMSPKF